MIPTANPSFLIAQNLLLSRFLTKCWKTQSTCQRRRMEYFSVCWFKSSAKNQFFYTCLNSLKPHFQTQGPRRSQLRRQLFISGFHGLISSDKAGARIRKLGRQTEVEAGRSSGSYHKIVFWIVFVLYLLNNREIFVCNFYLEIRRTEVGTYHQIVLMCNILCSFQEYLYNLILFVQYSWNICLRFWFGS